MHVDARRPRSRWLLVQTPPAAIPQPTEADFAIANFQVRVRRDTAAAEDPLPDLGHAEEGRAGGRPERGARDARHRRDGRRSSSGRTFAGELFGPGQPLDATQFYIIAPDDIGHGKSSKPSDGLRAKFPQYG